MSPDLELRRFHAGRVRNDYTALCDAQTALEYTRARRAHAQRVLDEVCRDVVSLEELEQALAARLASSRYDSIRLCVAALPDDILRCIFEATFPGDDDLSGSTKPFTLAAVCWKWRRVALALSPLWSSITVLFPWSAGLDRMKAVRNLVALRLERSRATLLDVTVFWVPPTPFQDHRAETIREFCAIMEALGDQVSRWRTARLILPALPDMGGGLSAIQCLKGSTPCLKELMLELRTSGPQPQAPSNQGYLPHAPVLRSLSLQGGRLAPSSRSAFPSLTELHLHNGGCTDEDLHGYLIRAPHLVDLEVNISVTRALRDKITLPELLSLKVGHQSPRLLFEPSSTFLHLPKLAHLSLVCTPDNAMTPFLARVSPTVRALQISHCLTLSHLGILRHLQSVEELHLISMIESVDNSTLDQLASNTTTPAWPHLTRITGVKFVDGIGDHLLRLIAARNPAAPEENGSQDSAWPARLREVTFRSRPAVPAWLSKEIGLILQC